MLPLTLRSKKIANFVISLLILAMLFAFLKSSCKAENQKTFLKIVSLVEKGEINEAETGLLQSLKTGEPLYIDHALYLWLSALPEKSFLQKAPPWLLLVEKIFPDSPLLFPIYYHSAKCYLKSGYLKQALAYAIKALQYAFLDEQRQQTLTLMVEVLIQEDKANEAGMLLKTIFKKYPTQQYLPTKDLFLQIFPKLELKNLSTSSLLELASFTLSLNLLQETQNILKAVGKHTLHPSQKEDFLILQIRYLLAKNDLQSLKELLEKYDKETHLRETLLFYKGVLNQRSANYREAIKYYQRLIQDYPSSSYLFNAYRNLLTCYQGLGDNENYATVITKALELFPQKDTFYLEWFHKALREKDFDQLKEILKNLQKSPTYKNQALFWMYKLNKNEEPELLWEIIKSGNVDYYFVRSWQELIQKGYNPQEIFKLENRSLPEMKNYLQELTLQLGKTEKRWQIYLFLKEKGFYRNAEIELLFLRHKNPSLKSLHLELAKLYTNLGEYRKAILHALYFQQNFSQASNNLTLLKNIYPLFFKEEVEKATRLFKGIDPYLVFALIRAESFFEANARSRAGAMGLAQIMPQTAQWMLETNKTKLKIETIDEETLLDPQVNIHICVAYLDYLFNKFEEKLLYTICSYNAGPGIVQQWLQSRPTDPDFFFENIPFSETKGYLEKVLVNYFYYSLIWKGSFLIEKPLS